MKKTLALLLTVCLLLPVFSGCSNQESPTSVPIAEASSATIPEAPPAEEPEEVPPVSSTIDSVEAEIVTELPPVELPIANHDVTLGIWYQWPPFLEGSALQSPNDFPFFQNLSQDTGVDFEFTSISMMATSEQFNLAVASQSFPDIIASPSTYSGSMDDAIENDVFMDVTDLLPEYAPHYLALLEDPDIRRDAVSQEGRVAVFWEIAKEPFPANTGLVVRQDWLDEIGMEVPGTYDELHDVLLAFKEKLGAESPLFNDGGTLYKPLTAGYDFQSGFCDIDGEAVYCATADGFKDYILMLNQWYSEGLIHPDFYVYEENSVDISNERTRLVNTNNVGVWSNWCEDLANYEVNDPDYKLTAMLNPKQSPEDEIHLCVGIDPMVSPMGGWALSTNIPEEEVPVALQVLDYLYSEEGSLMANWGREGDTFTYVDGVPRYTDVLMNNPDYATNMAIGIYCVFRGPILSDLSRFNQNVVGTLKEYCDVWAAQDNSYEIPTVSMDAADSERYNALLTDIETMLDENLPKFVIGDRPLSEFDAFMADLEQIGLQEMIDLEQKALDAYYTK